MTVWLPDIPAGVTLPLFFASYDSNGASITLTGLAVTDVEIFKGTSMTQRASDNGYTLIDTDGIDIDTITGIHGFSVDLADNSDAGFYAAGSFYHVVVDAVTIDSQTVRFIFAFRIVAAETLAGTPKADVTHWLGTAAATPTVAGVPEVDVTHLLGTAWLVPGTAGTPDVNVKLWNALTTVALPLIPTVAGRTLDVSAGGEAGVDWANVGSPTTTVGLTNTTVGIVTLVNTLTTYTGNTVQTGDSFARIGAAGAGLTAIDLPDQTMNITGNITGNVSGSVGSVTGAVGSVVGLTASNLDATVSSRASQASVDTIDDFLDTEVAAIKAKTDQLVFGATNTLNVNVEYVNAIQIIGAGTAGDPWGPV